MRLSSNNSSTKGNQARPADRATLAGRLASIHSADVLQGASILAGFASEAMQDATFTAGHGTHSQAEELACTIVAILRDSPKEFSNILPDYLQLLAIVRAFIVRQDAHNAAIAQFDRITSCLAMNDIGVIQNAAPVRPGLRQWRQIMRDKAVIAAAVLMAVFFWAVTSAHCATWHILAAIALVLGICGAAFRAGQHGLQTPVQIRSTGNKGR